MRIEFVARENGPEQLVCEAAIVFDDPGLLEGMKLVGFSIWTTSDGELYVTFPSRAFGASQERRYFDYLRPAELAAGKAGELEFNQARSKAVKDLILEAWAQAGKPGKSGK